MKTAQYIYTAGSGCSGNLRYKTIRRTGPRRKRHGLEGIVFVGLGVAAMLAPGAMTAFITGLCLALYGLTLAFFAFGSRE